jgi:hypothetical protein
MMFRRNLAPPVLVLAATRSGGELLVRALQADGALNARGDEGKVAALLEGRAGQASLADEERARATAAELTRELSARAPRRRLILHASSCASRAQEVAELLPNSPIVHLVRDGRVVALLGARASSEPGGLRPFARSWLEEISPLLQLEAASPERVVKVAYEELLAAPRDVLQTLYVALGIDGNPEVVAAELRNALRPDDELVFDGERLDSWQVLELEGELAPVPSLLGYPPASALDGVSAVRAQAARAGLAEADVERLKARVRELERRADIGPVPAATDPERLSALELPLDIATLRWKARRYDQIRAAASPLLRFRRRRARRRD